MCVAYCLPILVLAAAIFHAWRNDFSRNFVGAGVILFVASGLIARFLSRRAKNLEAVVYTTRVLPSDSEEKKSSVEVTAMLVAAAILLIAVFLPLFKS